MSTFNDAVGYVTGKSAKLLPPDFLAAGECQFKVLKDEGLKPDSTLLEIGCGCLLAGHFLIDYLAEGNYTAIEPNTWLVEAGTAYFALRKKFTFFEAKDFSAPGIFDFILAHSVLSHACESQLVQFFEAVKKQLSPDGNVYASLRLGADSHYEAWSYPDPSFFSPETVECCAEQAGLRLVHRPDIQKMMVERTQGEHHHDWIQLTQF